MAASFISLLQHSWRLTKLLSHPVRSVDDGWGIGRLSPSPLQLYEGCQLQCAVFILAHATCIHVANALWCRLAPTRPITGHAFPSTAVRDSMPVNLVLGGCDARQLPLSEMLSRYTRRGSCVREVIFISRGPIPMFAPPSGSWPGVFVPILVLTKALLSWSKFDVSEDLQLHFRPLDLYL